jgi:predicted transcriptional regulator of viral defense system
VPVFTTADASTVLELRTDAASQTLRRLGSAGLVVAVRRGLWAIDALPDRLSLVEYITAPYPAYVSLQSALYLRGVVDQIPEIVYVVSLGRRATVRTPAAVYSVHHLPSDLFGGFERDAGTGVKLARAEKALFDLLYLYGTRTRLFRALPELELPAAFNPNEIRRWIRKIPSRRLRTLTSRRLEELELRPAAQRRNRS